MKKDRARQTDSERQEVEKERERENKMWDKLYRIGDRKLQMGMTSGNYFVIPILSLQP